MKRIPRLIAVALIAGTLFCAAALSASATELKTGIGVVQASALRVRSKPTTSSDIVTTASKGDNLIIIRKTGDWYLVNCNLEIGYVSAEYVEVKDKANVKIGYASFDSTTNVRKEPSTSSDLVDQAPKGETCFIVGFNNEWYKVSYNGQMGYVRSDLVTLLEIPYSNAGSPGNTYKENANQTSTTSTTKTSSSTSENKKTETTSSSAASSSNSSLGEKIAAYAKTFVGYRYVYGGSSPSSGFDCSGLTSYVAKQFGYSIGRTAAAQLSAGSKVSRSDLKPGDIVLFARTYSSSEAATHAGIYLGDSKFVHAANSRSGVIISSLNESYYASRFVCGRRLG